MEQDFTYVITKKTDREAAKELSKIIKEAKKKNSVIKCFKIGNYLIYRIYKNQKKYIEHRTHTVIEEKNHYFEFNLKDFSILNSDILKNILEEFDFETINSKDDISFGENFEIFGKGKIDSLICYDKLNDRLNVGKFGDSSLFILKGPSSSSIITNSEEVRTLLEDKYKTYGRLNGIDVLYEVENGTISKRHDIKDKVEEKKEEIPVEGKKENIEEIPENTNVMDLLSTPKKTNPKAIALLNRGEFLTDKVYSINPSLERDDEIRELEKYLMIPKKGVLIVGKTGVGKTSVVEGLAFKIRSSDVCDRLKDKKIFSISISSLMSGTKYRGDLEEKIEQLCNYITEQNDIILFLDEIHAGINDNNYESPSLGIADIIKPYISNRGLKVKGITTDEEFEMLRGSDAFLRRFNILEIKELEHDKLIKILIDHIYFNEFDIDINMKEEEIQRLCDIIIRLSSRRPKFVYKERSNPDSSINIIDNCFAYLIVSNIKSASYKDFIEGILNNKNLSISEFDTSMLALPEDDTERAKIIQLAKK